MDAPINQQGLLTRPRLLDVIIGAGIIGWAIINHFIQDDAFISFRYAFNLVSGHGLVWNINTPPIEGYTNFLWTLIISVGMLLGIDPIIFSQSIGILFAIGSLVFVYKLCNLIFEDNRATTVALILLGTNYTFSAFSTGGLETQMQTCLLTMAVYETFSAMTSQNWTWLSLSILSAIFIAALLTRLDSALILGVLFIYLVWKLGHSSFSFQFKAVRVMIIAMPIAAIISVWFRWKVSFYGDILPNSFYSRVLGQASIQRGYHYLYAFVMSYQLLPSVALILYSVGNRLKRIERLVIAIAIILWLGYIIAVGGDFMEFRMFVPILPLLFVLLAGAIRSLNEWRVQVAIIIALVLASFTHVLLFRSWMPYEIAATSVMDENVNRPDFNWKQVGVVLNDLFAKQDPEVVIATTAAGAIPFYSKLPTVDMHGINDRWVAVNGIPIGTRPGHQRIAPIAYLLDRKVNLVLGHPQIDKRDSLIRRQYMLSDLSRFSLRDVSAALIPDTATVIEIPLSRDYMISVLYLVRSDSVDKVIKRDDLRTIEIQRNQ